MKSSPPDIILSDVSLTAKEMDLSVFGEKITQDVFLLGPFNI